MSSLFGESFCSVIRVWAHVVECNMIWLSQKNNIMTIVKTMNDGITILIFFPETTIASIHQKTCVAVQPDSHIRLAIS
jgi:hypothetical protein